MDRNPLLISMLEADELQRQLGRRAASGDPNARVREVVSRFRSGHDPIALARGLTRTERLQLVKQIGTKHPLFHHLKADVSARRYEAEMERAQEHPVGSTVWTRITGRAAGHLSAVHNAARKVRRSAHEYLPPQPGEGEAEYRARLNFPRGLLGQTHRPEDLDDAVKHHFGDGAR